MALQFIITNAGRAAMINPAGGMKAVQIVAVGVSPTAVTATADATTLPGEVKRITTIAGDAIAADMIHMIVRDETDAGYSVRSFALYLQDGTLFGIYGQPAVILEKSAGAVFLLAVDLTLVNEPAANITFGATNFLNPPATIERAGVVELATDAEATALVDALRALTPKNMAAIFTAANILSRLIQIDGAGSGLDADLLDGRQLGTIGDAIPSLAGNNEWGGEQTFDRSVRITAPAVKGGNLGGIEIYNTARGNNWFAGMRAYSPDGTAGFNFVDLRFYTTHTELLESMRLTTDGRLGIGTTSPASKLHVTGDATFQGPVRIAGNGEPGSMLGGYEIYNTKPENGWFAGMRAFSPDGAPGYNFVDLRFYTTHAKLLEAMRLTTEGRLGIGTVSPASKLHVTGDATFQGPVRIAGSGEPGSLLGGYEIYNTKPENGWFAGMRAFSPDGAPGYNYVDLRFYTTSVNLLEAMRLTADGRLGIGTTNPTSKLHVTGDATFQGPVRISVAGIKGGLLGGYEVYNGPQVNGSFAGMRAYSPDGAIGLNFVDLRFYTTNTAVAEVMRLTVDGRLGIGTTAPTAKLHVAGNAAIDGPLLVGGATVWNAANDGAGSGLDADLLDGRDSSAYAQLAATAAFTGNASFARPVGVGTTTPLRRLSVTITGTGVDGLGLHNDSATGDDSHGVAIIASNTANTFRNWLSFHGASLRFLTQDIERMRVDGSGTVHVNGPRARTGDVPGNGSLRALPATAGGYAFSTSDTVNYTAHQFIRQINGSASQVGSITCTETSTAYNTSSDYRLKQDVAPLTGALDRLLRLPALRFAFKAMPERRVDGFLAHDLAAVIPEAVHGEKDAVNDDGDPIYQQIDQSKIVPLLVAAVQELAAEVAALKAAT